MNIKLRTLSISNYDKYDIEKNIFARMIKRDKEILEEACPSIYERIIESSDIDELVSGPAYIVYDDQKDKSIGFIQINSYLFEDEVVLNYGLLKRYRFHGYGEKILEEVSEYLFDNGDIKKITLNIYKDNFPSVMCAKKAGYELERVSSSEIFTYVKMKK